MITGADFLVFGDDWGVYPTTTEHLLRRLVPHNRFLWVHLPGLRAFGLNRYDVRRARQKLVSWTTARRAHDVDGVSLYSPLVVPRNTNALIRAFNRRSVIAGTQRRLAALGMRLPIVATSLPNASDVAGAFGERLIVYLCEDEYAEMPGVARSFVLETEARLLEQADVVFATSRALALRKSGSHGPAIFLPQGVDVDHFNGARESGVPPPGDVADLPRPVIGFVGMLASWVDLELIAAVARAYPRASVVVIGPTRTDITPLRGVDNISVLGPRPYADVPRYMAHFDVGLIPFHRSTLTRYVNPLKLLEYFAAGLPVVSTAMADVETNNDLVYCATTHDEFLGLVGKALHEYADDLRSRRLMTAQANSWQARAEEFCVHVLAALQRRGAA